MLIDVTLTPAEIALLPQHDLSTTTCVVFDVLRATSSMVTALAHGAAEIYPVCTVEEAFALKERLPHAVLAGERHGEKIEGFALGNAPQEYLELAGQTIISTTTNGTIALRACENAERVLVGAMLNLSTLAACLERESPERLLLVCAGTFASFALEDACAAGWLLRAIPQAELTDAARAVGAVADSYPDAISALRAARNGRTLLAKGREAELDWCARESVFNVLGSMEHAVIRPYAP